MGLHDLLFELSSEDRHRILLRLLGGAAKLTHISRDLEIPVQEVSRQLTRLEKVDLVSKDVDGSYEITPYGKLTLDLMKSQEFVTDHSEYFNTHDLGGVPPGFVKRIDELSGSRLIEEVVVYIHDVERIFQEAEDHVWCLVDQYIASTIPICREAFRRGVKARTIDVKDFEPPHELLEAVTPEDSKVWHAALADGRLEMKMIDEIDVVLWMNEKEVAVVSFPSLDGRFDYTGFTSKDERAIKWCEELYLYFWERSAPKLEFSFF